MTQTSGQASKAIKRLTELGVKADEVRVGTSWFAYARLIHSSWAATFAGPDSSISEGTEGPGLCEVLWCGRITGPEDVRAVTG
jgi:hypothetical protein